MPSNATDKRVNIEVTIKNDCIDYDDTTRKIICKKDGEANLKITSVSNPEVSHSFKLIVGAGNPIFAESISLNTYSLSLETGKTSQLTATVNPTNATNKNVTWSCSDESIATVDQTGKVTAVKAGTVDITVTTEDGNKTAVCKVKVIEPIECILNYNNYTFKDLNQSLQIQASLNSGYATTFIYKSTREDVLIVDNNGKVIPVKGGFANIEVTDNVYGKNNFKMLCTSSCSVK